MPFRFANSNVLVGLFLALLGLLPVWTFANEKPLVATKVSQTDRDYWFQGEYLGSVTNPCGWCECHGLQVVALGKNQFQAVLYSGGLPGGGWWTGQERHELRGSRDGELLKLEGERHRIEITNSCASIWGVNSPSQNRWPGELIRVERKSQTLGACPPPGAIVLFNGSDTDHWKNAKVTEDKLLQIGTETTEPYRDFYMHIEFLLPYMPQARGQGRANSGVYIQSRYEVQVLDSFGLKGENNEAGSLYKFKGPDANLCFPPLVWQTYDIEFQSPTFDSADKKQSDARISVWHNGVLIQNHLALANKTGGGAAEGKKPLPTKLQDHGNPVRFRNIWLIERHRGTLTLPNCCPQVVTHCQEVLSR